MGLYIYCNLIINSLQQIQIGYLRLGNALVPVDTTNQTAQYEVISQMKNLPMLRLNTTRGTTTDSPAGFSYSPSNDTFAYCSGAVAVLAKVNDGRISSTKYFRFRPYQGNDQPAKKNASPAPRYDQVCSTSRLARRYTADEYGNLGSPTSKRRIDFTSRSKQERAQAVTCLSLSVDGKLLAIGEVSQPASLQTFHSLTAARRVQNHVYSFIKPIARIPLCLKPLFSIIPGAFQAWHFLLTDVGSVQWVITMMASFSFGR